jgi:lipid-A-disaccharide synthase
MWTRRQAEGAASLLIVAGEPSGDRIAAGIARAAAARKLRCFGMGGGAAAATGLELVDDLGCGSAMGFTEVARRIPALLRAYRRLRQRIEKAPPAAAVLVDFVEFNWRLGKFLRKSGVPVLWCVAPQVWAWRPGRRHSFGRALDRMAVILPFEEALWRAVGVDAHYIGHPALDEAPGRSTRAELGLDDDSPAVALLPGSRADEVHRHAPPMLAAIAEVGRRHRRVQARLLAAPWLDRGTRLWLESLGRSAGVPLVAVRPDAGAAAELPAFDAALVASGTASLECALAGALPVVVYRVSPLTAAIARKLMRTRFVALPNVLLGYECFPELLQEQVEPLRMARALETVLERGGERQKLMARLRDHLSSDAVGDGERATSGERAFALLGDWLAPGKMPADGRRGGEREPNSLGLFR